jgi:hypothetical protein
MRMFINVYTIRLQVNFAEEVSEREEEKGGGCKMKEPEKITITFNGKISKEAISKFVHILVETEREQNMEKNKNQSQSDK